MSKYYLGNTEWFPVLHLINYKASYRAGGIEGAEFTDDEIADLSRIEREFNDWQRRLAERFQLKGNPNQYDRELIDRRDDYSDSP